MSAPSEEGLDLAPRVTRLALALGFDLCGISDPEPCERVAFFSEWIARGYAGEMGYLERRAAERSDPRLIMPGLRSLIMVALVYGDRPLGREEAIPAQAGRGVVASYAGGDDYHDVMGERLHALADALPVLAARPVRTRVYVATGPLLERVFAARAGLGWIGKNTCVIHPDLGSRFFLGALLSDLPLPPEPAPPPDHCGTCTACLDACPTGAFPTPYVLDARRCLSYTTIEVRGGIEETMRAGQGPHVFGCDICQTVCPWNQSRPLESLADPLGLRARLRPRADWILPDLARLLELNDSDWRAASRGTALRRAGLRGLVRNALIAAGNLGDARLRPAVERHAGGDDPMLAEHARWALARIGASGESADRGDST